MCLYILNPFANGHCLLKLSESILGPRKDKNGMAAGDIQMIKSMDCAQLFINNLILTKEKHNLTKS